MKNSVLIIGASSFLGANLLPKIDPNTHDVTTISVHLGEQIPYEDIINKKYSCVVYLKPEADQKLIDINAREYVALLAIGSGSVVDFNAGRIVINPYVGEKLKLVKMSSVIIHPGFYIPDKNHKDTGRGLHRETLFNLFNATNVPSEEYLKKAYYMTPVAKLIELIVRFIEKPTLFPIGEYAFGSKMAITRKELFEGTRPQGKHIYANNMALITKFLDMEVTDEDISHFTENAKSWVQTNNKNKI